MSDDFRLPGQRSGTLVEPAKGDQPELSNTAEDIDLSTLSLMGLLSLRNRITAMLPASDLKDMDLTRELVLQVTALQELQRLTMGATDVPANQQAQVANSLSAALVNLVKVQSEVHTTERFKRVERAVVEFINELPELDQRRRAFELYDRAVRVTVGE